MTAASNYEPGPISCEGAAFDDFRLTAHLPPDAAPAVIEQDRLYMAARPGFNRKLLPLRVDPVAGTAWSGGRYLLDTFAQAREFADWVANEFELDGTLILQRPDFAEVTTHVWRVLGAYDFKDVRTSQHVYRTEIWKLAPETSGDRLANRWPALRDEAAELGRSALWLLYDEASEEASLVTVAQRSAPPAAGLDFASIAALEQAPSLGAALEQGGHAHKTFDRTHWVFTIWFPVTGAAGDLPALWPNSPPLPAPVPYGHGVERGRHTGRGGDRGPNRNRPA
jgi:hypothetical protein